MKIELDFTPLDRVFLDLDKQYVKVEVLDNGVKAASADYSKPLTALVTLSGSTPRRKVKTKGRQKNITLFALAEKLDAEKQIFSSVMENSANKELVALAELFAIPVKTNGEIKELENIARGLVRNPILRGDYNPNSLEYQKIKGFNHWGFSTGTLYKNIVSGYKKQ